MLSFSGPQNAMDSSKPHACTNEFCWTISVGRTRYRASFALVTKVQTPSHRLHNQIVNTCVAQCAREIGGDPITLTLEEGRYIYPIL